MTVIATGNPFDGVTLYGPFDDAEHAMLWADANVRDEGWRVVKIREPYGRFATNERKGD